MWLLRLLVLPVLSILLCFWVVFPSESRVVTWIIAGIVLAAGMLKTASTFFADTAEKHASPAPVRTADHPISTC